jgi:hypothetical protein
MASVIDHIVVVAPTLTSGAAFARNALGVEPQLGGSHARMGTHNLLLSLGESTYLEVIAIDPEAPKPARARWFALDELSAAASPYLAAWVVRTRDIRAASAAYASVVGQVEQMSRGTFSWEITITPDGSLPMGGAAPALIEWKTKTHPAQMLTPLGCSLLELEIHHPEPPKLNALLESIGLESPLRVVQSKRARPTLVAHIQTPYGLRELSTA